MSWLLAIGGFAALVILHELGHFAVAKATGMRVERFFLFFPPKVVSVRRGETEYGIGAIPLGGFVKITGMNPDEELEAEVAPRAYYHQPVWRRIAVIAAGPVMNVLIAFLLLFGLAFGIEEAKGLAVGEIVSDSPAAAKLERRDLIVSVDGHRARGLGAEERAERLAELIDRHRCAGEPTDGCRARTPAEVVIERDGKRMALEIRPYYDAEEDQNRLGFAYAPARREPLDPSVPGAAEISVETMWRVTSVTLSTFAQLFDPERREELSSVVGATEVTRQAFEFNSRVALQLLAIISLSLALINLFPFLPLDGGHIFWSLVEKVRGRPVPFSVMERAGVIGFVLVLFIFFIGLSNDIDRLSGEGFDVR